MSFDKPDSYLHCGAKTRQGTPCKAPAMHNARCRMHGGKSPRRVTSPHFKNGYYAQDWLCKMLWFKIQHNYQRNLVAERLSRYLETHPHPRRQNYQTHRAYRRALDNWEAGAFVTQFDKLGDVIPPEMAQEAFDTYMEGVDTSDKLSFMAHVLSSA